MSTLVVDTHDFVQSLEAAGIKRAQAEAIIENLKKIQVDSYSKEETNKFKSEFKDDFHALKIEILDNRLASEKRFNDLQRWMIAILVGQVGLFFAAIKIFGNL